ALSQWPASGTETRRRTEEPAQGLAGERTAGLIPSAAAHWPAVRGVRPGRRCSEVSVFKASRVAPVKAGAQTPSAQSGIADWRDLDFNPARRPAARPYRPTVRGS